MPTDMKLPELGENVEKGDVVRVLVKAGDTIKKDQPVVELETDKATIEVPSDVDGTVADVKVKPGDRVKVGQVILTVNSGAAKVEGAEKTESAEKTSKSAQPERAAKPREDAPAQPADAAPPKKEDAPRPALRRFNLGVPLHYARSQLGGKRKLGTSWGRAPGVRPFRLLTPSPNPRSPTP